MLEIYTSRGYLTGLSRLHLSRLLAVPIRIILNGIRVFQWSALRILEWLRCRYWNLRDIA
jgi:hypothetical protein